MCVFVNMYVCMCVLGRGRVGEWGWGGVLGKESWFDA